MSHKNGAKLFSKARKIPAHKTCADWLMQDYGKKSGVYMVEVLGKSRKVFCHMDDGGGWMAFQRRYNGSVDFKRKWYDYKLGFGNGEGEYWLGNKAIHQLTNSADYDLLIVVKIF